MVGFVSDTPSDDFLTEWFIFHFQQFVYLSVRQILLCLCGLAMLSRCRFNCAHSYRVYKSFFDRLLLPAAASTKFTNVSGNLEWRSYQFPF